MHWTKERPTKPGYYWVYEEFEHGSTKLDIIHIHAEEKTDKLVEQYDEEVPHYFDQFTGDFHFMGPIPKPTIPL